MADQLFSSSYKGDPGVPHSGRDRFTNIYFGGALFSVYTWFNPYLCSLSTEFNWQDKTILFEHYHWKKAKAQGKKHKFLYNTTDKAIRDSYYEHQSVCFP